MYGVTWLLDWTHLFGATQSREVIDEFARWTADEVDYLVEARQAALLHEHAKGDTVRAHRPRLPRLHDVARADDRADRRDPADRGDDRPARRRPGLPRRARGRRSRPRPDRAPPRLEHAQPGVRVRLLPRRPAPGEHLRARRATRSATWTSASSASSRTGSGSRSRGTAGCCSGARSRPRSRELMRWLAPTPSTDVAAARGRLLRVHQTFLYDASADRSRVTAAAPGTDRREPGEPVLAARRRHPRDRRATTSSRCRRASWATSRCW